MQYHAEMTVAIPYDGSVRVPCADVGTVVEETGGRRWGCDHYGDHRSRR